MELRYNRAEAEAEAHTFFEQAMELWVSGFNAWNQLQFVGDLPQEPEDMVSFRSVLRAAHIELIHASVSSTMGISFIASFLAFFFNYILFSSSQSLLLT